MPVDIEGDKLMTAPCGYMVPDRAHSSSARTLRLDLVHFLAGILWQLQYNQNTYVVMAAFMGKKASVRFGISKETYWAGENLTEEQKKTMKYVVVISFLHCKTAATPCVITNDWLRCIP
jgi:hypothetical protein